MRTVFVVENQVTYLAFPTPDAIVVFGEGFKASTLDAVPWLADRELVYWGDIDTHGFRIPSTSPGGVPGVRSLLMDESTLSAHLDRVVSEDAPDVGPARAPQLPRSRISTGTWSRTGSDRRSA